MSGPLHTLRAEAGPDVRHDEFTDGNRTTNALAYTALSYSYKLTDGAYFIQGVSVLASKDSTLNYETGLRVDLNKRFALKVTYNYSHNSRLPSTAPDKTDTKTQVSIIYNIPLCSDVAFRNRAPIFAPWRYLIKPRIRPDILSDTLKASEELKRRKMVLLLLMLS